MIQEYSDHNMVSVTLMKSLIGRLKKHVKTARAIGLNKIGKTKVMPSNACNLGMINQIKYLVSIKEVNSNATQ